MELQNRILIIIQEFAMRAPSKTTFSKRLLSYSIAASAIIGAASTASAQVSGSTIGVTLSTNGAIRNISFDGVQKYKISFFHSDTYNSAKIGTATAGAFWAVGGPSIRPIANNYGALINAGKDFGNVPPGASARIFVVFGGGTPYGASFVGKGDKYIGFRFKIGSNTHYGWLKVNVAVGGGSITLISSAYETTSDTEISCDGVLPVELTSFSAQMQGTMTSLDWQTATEVNNYGFDIERNTYPDFKEGETQTNAWEKIGFIPGNGNSNSPKSYRFVDENPPSGLVMYRLKQIDNDGTTEYSKLVTIENNAPQGFALLQNYPNPFNPGTRIQYSVPKDGLVTLKVYDMLGTEVASLVNEQKQAGTHTYLFDAANLPSGTYVYRIQSGEFTESKKLTLIK